MQPVSFSSLSQEYRVNPIKSNQSRMSNRQRAYTEDYASRREMFARAYQQAVNIANMRDEQLLTLAKIDAHRDDKYKKNTYAAALIGVPVVDTFVRGAFAEAPHLSGKLSTMGKAAAGWAGAFALAGLYGGMVNKVSAVSPVVRNFEEKHPVIKSLLTLAGFAAVLIGTTKGINKLSTAAAKKFPEIAESAAKFKTSVANTINNSKLNSKIAQPLKAKLIKLAEKYPRTAGVTLSALVWSAPVMAIGTVFKAFTDKAEKAEQTKDTYKQLIATREMNRRIVDKINNNVQEVQIAKIANALAETELAEAKEDIDAEKAKSTAPEENECD